MPRHCSFNRAPLCVDRALPVPRSPPVRPRPLPPMHWHRGVEPLMPAQFPRRPGITPTIRLADSACVAELATLHVSHALCAPLLQITRIIVLTCQTLRRRTKIALLVQERAASAGRCLLAAVLRAAVAPGLASVCLPSRCSTDTCKSYRIVRTPAAARRWQRPARRHCRTW